MNLKKISSCQNYKTGWPPEQPNKNWIFSEPRIGVLLSRKSNFYGSFQIHGSGWSPSTTNQNNGFFSESRIGVLLSRKSNFYGSFQIHGSGWSPSTTNQNNGFFSESPKIKFTQRFQLDQLQQLILIAFGQTDAHQIRASADK